MTAEEIAIQLHEEGPVIKTVHIVTRKKVPIAQRQSVNAPIVWREKLTSGTTSE